MPNIHLKPFAESNAGIILQWRNAAAVRANMIDNSIISPAMHERFLATLQEDATKKYYLVEIGRTPVATLYFTEIGAAIVTWGCYIGPGIMIPGLFPALVVLAANVAFSLPSTQVLRSEVAVHNPSPIKMNKFLGIPEVARRRKRTSCGETIEFLEYQLEKRNRESVQEKALAIMPRAMRANVQSFEMER
jgi:hypothetical protein